MQLQNSTIKKFLEDKDVKKTICLIPEANFKGNKNGISQTKINLKKFIIMIRSQQKWQRESKRLQGMQLENKICLMKLKELKL